MDGGRGRIRIQGLSPGVGHPRQPPELESESEVAGSSHASPFGQGEAWRCTEDVAGQGAGLRRLGFACGAEASSQV